MKKTIASFSIDYTQILDEEGNIDTNLDPHLPEPLLKSMYHLMVLARIYDHKMFTLQRQGKIGTYAQVKGQEAAQVGSAMALEKTDWVIPSFREATVSMVRGADRVKLVQAWRGDTRANQGDKNCRDLPPAIPIGSQALHAVGIAWAAQMRKEKTAAITYFGDGGTSEGDVHEAMNFAAVFQLPCIFFCQNNQWAISTPRQQQTRSETIAQKAIAYGMPGIQVDGNDIIAVYTATKQALDRAKNGGGPTFIEALTYRMSDHTTSDDSSRYRNEADVKTWEIKDPIKRLRQYFQKNNQWTDDYGLWVEQECEKEINTAIEKALLITPPPPEDVFNYIFDTMTPDLKEELADLQDELKGGAP